MIVSTLALSTNIMTPLPPALTPCAPMHEIQTMLWPTLVRAKLLLLPQCGGEKRKTMYHGKPSLHSKAVK